MYLLNEAPIFLEFFKKTMNLIEDKPKISRKFENEFYIAGKCNCNQSDCATVILRRKKEWSKKDGYGAQLNTFKGYVNINLLDNGYLEVECTAYKEFPHKYEINKLFAKKKYINKSYPRISKRIKNLTKKEKNKINRYFKFKNRVSLYEQSIYDKLDYRSTKNSKLFNHAI